MALAGDFYGDIELHNNQIKNGKFEKLPAPPTNPETARFYFDTTDNHFYGWNGLEWLNFGTLDEHLLMIQEAKVAAEAAAVASLDYKTDVLDAFRDESSDLVKLSGDALVIDSGFTPTFGGADQTSISDVGGYFVDTKVEGALQEIGIKLAGTFSSTTRPVNRAVGSMGFDTTLNKPIWLKTAPNIWVDAMGTIV